MDARIADFTLMANENPVPVESLGCEQQAALRDLVAVSHFQPLGDTTGPYSVKMAIMDARLVLAIRNGAGVDLSTLVMSLRPYRRVISDYFLMIRSFEEARRTASPAKLEAIDMGRRGLHNEGAQLLMDRLADKLEMDFETARRLFTMLCALQRDQIGTLG